MRFSALSIAIVLSATIVQNVAASDRGSDIETLPPPIQSSVFDDDAFSPPRSMLHRPIVNAQPRVDQVDLQAAFAAQELSDTGLSVLAVGFGHAGGALGCGGGCDAGCGHRASASCETCVPHQPVHLPSSTFLQYFRSNKCNTNVWDGYQQKCGFAHKHVTGQCDCFNKRGCAGACGCEVLPPMPRKPCGLGKRRGCDAPGCDAPGCDGPGCDAPGCESCGH